MTRKREVRLVHADEPSPEQRLAMAELVAETVVRKARNCNQLGWDITPEFIEEVKSDPFLLWKIVAGK